MRDIIFLCSHSYSGDDVRTKALGGIETATILLAEALAELGHSVTIYNERETLDQCRNVTYKPLRTASGLKADIAISNSSAKHLRLVKTEYPIVWQRNRTNLSRIWKRGEFFALFKVRPILVSLSNDALNTTPKYVPYRARHVIPHAIEPKFLEVSSASADERGQTAFFASRPSRNLDWVIEVWKQFIFPTLPEAKLYICIPPTAKFNHDPQDLLSYNIEYKGSLPKAQLADLMNSCRILMYPGHINETGCQVALQAIGLGLPIISCGFGSLKDLVSHQETGFIETEQSAYADKAIQCLTDSALWERLHQNSLIHKWRKSYQDRTNDWLSLASK